MAKQTFTAGQVLTATQMNNLQANDYNWTTSAQTSSYVLVAANAGQTVTMTNASATTITVNTGLFTAGDTVRIINLGAGACTITAGTATVNSASSLALAQYQAGTLWFSSASASIFFPDDVTAASSGMVLINTTSISAASTTNVNNVFSATYQNYYINFTMSNISTTDMRTGFRLRAAGTDAVVNYNSQRVGGYQSTTFSESDPMGTDEWFFVQGNSGTPTNSAVSFWIYNPFDVSPTKFISQSFDRSSTIGLIVGNNMGHNTNATSYDGFTLQTATGTISGTLRIYGLRNSV